MSFYSRLKTTLVGHSLTTSAHAEERLSNAEGLAVLSSDALSSVAYATEETLLVLMGSGSIAFWYSLPITIAIVMLLSSSCSPTDKPLKPIPRAEDRTSSRGKTWVSILG